MCTPSQSRSEAELESSAFLRNQPRAPVSQFTYTATGSGGVLLNGGISYSPDGSRQARFFGKHQQRLHE